MKFTFRASPNYRDSKSTTEIMKDVTICLLAVLTFSAVWYGVSYGLNYGIRVVLLALCSVVSALVTEAVYFRIRGKDIVHGLTHSYAWVTALIIVLISKVDTSYYAVIVSTSLALIFGKLVFGGFGQNIFNPAAFGAALITNSFSASASADFVTGATPLSPMQSAGWVMDPINLGSYINEFGGFGNMLIGNYASVIGGSCALLIILCYAFLTWRKDLNWRTPLVYVGTIAVISLIAGLATGQGIEFMCINLLAGGVMFCGVFMLTDPVTSPVTISGRYIFAVGAAVFTLLIRWKSNLPDGALYSILLMNMLTPAIDLACDGSLIKDIKKIQMRTVIICALTALVGIAVGVTLKPAAAEESTATAPVEETTGGEEAESGSQDLSQFEAVAEEVSNDGTTAVYDCSAKGFGLVTGAGDDYSENEAEVTVNLSDMTVESVELIHFGDTEGVGDKATSDDALAAYEGVSSADEVDAVSSATYTSGSIQAMVQAALDAAAE